MTAISLQGLTKRFGKRMAVDGLDLDIEKGELFALLGANGAGKTTTIRMLCGLCEPDAGDAVLLSKSIKKDTEAVKEMINVSPQETAVAPNLTTEENLELMARIYGASKDKARNHAREMLERFDLASRTHDRAKKLSGGMQRRLSIAMALISEPKYSFLTSRRWALTSGRGGSFGKRLRRLKGI